MAQNLKVTPPDDEDRNRDRFTLQVGPFKLEAVGKFLHKRGSLLGIAVVVGSVAAVLALLGDKLWGLFK